MFVETYTIEYDNLITKSYISSLNMKIPRKYTCRQHVLDSRWPPGHVTLTSHKTKILKMTTTQKA